MRDEEKSSVQTVGPGRPPLATRFSRDRQPEDIGGRTPTKHLRQMLSQSAGKCPSAVEFRRVCKLEGDTSIRQALDERLIQIAFTDRSIVIGYDNKNQAPIERVSSAECIKAIEILKKYDMGPPPKSDSKLEWAEHIRQVERDRIATAISILGPKLREKPPKEIAAYFSELCNAPDKFLIQAAQLMGETQDVPGAAVAELENARPKDRDTADHAPDATAANGTQPELSAENSEGEP